MKKIWDKIKILECLKRFPSNITVSELRQKDVALFGACERYFGTVNNAKRVIGFKNFPPGRVAVVPDLSFKRINEKFGYIVGAILGDGWVYDSHIVLEVADKSFADFFANQLFA